MYGDDYILAVCLYFVGIAIAATDFITREEYSEYRGFKKLAMVGSTTIVGILAFALSVAWVQLRKTDVRSAQIPPRSDPFVVRVEGKAGGYGSAFWFVQRAGAAGCVISPINLLMFLRITNHKPTKTLITGYSASVNVKGEWEALKRLDTRFGGEVIWAFNKTSPPLVPAIGRVIDLPEGSYRINGVDPGKVDFEHAALIGYQRLDDLIGERYVEPGDSVRGWTAFSYTGVGDEMGSLQITIKDEADSFPYITPPIDPDPSDLMQHPLTVITARNVSGCSGPSPNPSESDNGSKRKAKQVATASPKPAQQIISAPQGIAIGAQPAPSQTQPPSSTKK